MILFLALALASCKDDAEETPTPQPDPEHAYKGDWEGTFDGGDSGTWTMVCDKDGKFTGQFYSNNSQSYFDVVGNVDDKGKFKATIDVNGVILDFDGQGTDGKTASGTWGNPSINLTGTWTGAKK